MGLGSQSLHQMGGGDDPERASTPGFAPADTGSCRPQDTTMVSSTGHGPASCHVSMPCSHQGSSAITQLDLTPDRGNSAGNRDCNTDHHTDTWCMPCYTPCSCCQLALRMPRRVLCPPGLLQPGSLSDTPAALPSCSTPRRRHPGH